jgi:OOP family OmpA-OmpF porin
MSSASVSSVRRYRRRILGWGAAIAAVWSLVTALIANETRVEPDLERRVPAELAEAGFAGITASFSGQDGTLTCTSRLDDPDAVADLAADVRGVSSIDLDESCSAGTTVLDLIRSDPQFSTFASLIDQSGFDDVISGVGQFTVFAPTDGAFESLPADVLAAVRRDPEVLEAVLGNHVVAGFAPSTSLTPGALRTVADRQLVISVDGVDVRIDSANVIDTDVNATNGVIHVVDGVLLPADLALDLTGDTTTTPPVTGAAAAATFDGGRITLTGAVASEDERAAVVAALDGVVAAESIDDQLVVDPAGLDATTAGPFARLVAAMPASLVSGQVTFDGAALAISGVYVDDAANAALAALAGEVGATASLQPRPDATTADAASLETELNDFVSADPILFESGSAQLTPAAEAVLDQVAAIAKRYGGIGITVEGHTDSDGPDDENQSLSERRAQEVVEALVARGVPAADLAAEGFGESQPVLVEGVEDKDQSRRVEFRVLTQ